MKTLIALDDQEELIDKFESAADGINQDMALAEKALKVQAMNHKANQQNGPEVGTRAIAQIVSITKMEVRQHNGAKP